MSLLCIAIGSFLCGVVFTYTSVQTLRVANLHVGSGALLEFQLISKLKRLIPLEKMVALENGLYCIIFC